MTTTESRPCFYCGVVSVHPNYPQECVDIGDGNLICLTCFNHSDYSSPLWRPTEKTRAYRPANNKKDKENERR